MQREMDSRIIAPSLVELDGNPFTQWTVKTNRAIAFTPVKY
jgi:hypothetical protein